MLTEALPKIFIGIRILVWGFLISQLLFLGIQAIRAYEPNTVQESYVPGGLWPGDWVPHPNLPEPQPEDNDA